MDTQSKEQENQPQTKNKKRQHPSTNRHPHIHHRNNKPNQPTHQTTIPQQ